jgi:hypothetical protein
MWQKLKEQSDLMLLRESLQSLQSNIISYALTTLDSQERDRHKEISRVSKRGAPQPDYISKTQRMSNIWLFSKHSGTASAKEF